MGLFEVIVMPEQLVDEAAYIVIASNHHEAVSMVKQKYNIDIQVEWYLLTDDLTKPSFCQLS